MEILLEQELGSIVRFVQDNAEHLHRYFLEVPENFLIPAIYFPIPETEAKKVTLNTMETTLTWYINVFAVDSIQAYNEASRITNQIIFQRCRIPIRNAEGQEEDKELRLLPPKVKKVERGIAQIVLSVKRYTELAESGQKSKDIYINFSSTVLDAYKKVIEQFAEKEKPAEKKEGENGENGEKAGQ